MEFNTEFLQFSTPWTFIYTLRIQMGDCFDKYERRPDGGYGSFGRTTVRPKF
jgi:hypothetical protein